MNANAQTPALDTVPQPAELVARARALVPTLRERSQHCEQLRRIPQETFDDFRDAGLLRIAQPSQFQGWGHGIDTIAEVGMEIGRGCGSSAWMAGQWPGHQFMVGYFSEEAQQEYWAQDPDTMSSTASAQARVNIEPERGGFRVRDSQMRFSSGCDYAQWIFFTTQHGMGLIPRSDFEVLDDWHVSGLRGTGSKSVVVKDAWIPPHRCVSLADLRMGSTPGSKIYTGNPYYQVPFNLVVNQLLLAATIGMGRGILDLFEERVTKRFDLHTFKPASEGAGTQLRFAESAAEIDAAMMFIRNNCVTLAEWGRAGHVPSDAERARVRRDVAYATRLSLQASNRLITSGDASAMFDSQQLGRLARDINMAGLQANLTWDEPAQSFSRARWGVSPLSNLN
ncbi:acyl-CoA dehydrogenase family protein [Pseudomonas sp. NBRC 100443]|uniref:acyl-CoA dehydrogenase family protein n=1 Tax=Pseudomonas sp. NBRC 100443 TaxID=1113665 RepID=UPI0024A5FD88|nr:acyl-CoA dehydrogenase family protein [Pseudomonas sp. NBRC 100443]GLU37335.1 pigment protein [Pseudomonas sp. NBRC 100443]